MNRDRKLGKAPKRAYVSYKKSDRRQAVGSNPSQYFNKKTYVDPQTIARIKTSKPQTNVESGKKKAVVRHDPKTGRIWHDTTLTEWDPSHFRLFVGNIAVDVTEELLVETFIKYPSLSKVKVPMDEQKGDNKGFAFLSFADPEDYLQCYKEMNGKYVGSKPVTLERAKTEIGDVVKVASKAKDNKKRR